MTRTIPKEREKKKPVLPQSLTDEPIRTESQAQQIIYHILHRRTIPMNFCYDCISKQGVNATKTKKVTENEREGKDVSERKC